MIEITVFNRPQCDLIEAFSWTWLAESGYGTEHIKLFLEPSGIAYRVEVAVLAQGVVLDMVDKYKEHMAEFPFITPMAQYGRVRFCDSEYKDHLFKMRFVVEPLAISMIYLN